MSDAKNISELFNDSHLYFSRSCLCSTHTTHMRVVSQDSALFCFLLSPHLVLAVRDVGGGLSCLYTPLASRDSHLVYFYFTFMIIGAFIQ